jgi:integrase
MTGLREKDMIEIPPLPLDEGLFEREVSKTKRWRATARRRVGRTIPFEINEEVRAVLRRLYALDRPQSTQVLFCNERGRPFKSSGFQTAWRRVMLRTAAEGVEWFHEHDIRATVANADPANAQKRLTHKNRTTTDAYLRKFRTEVVPALPMKMIEEREQAAEAAGNIHQLEMRKVK